MSSKMPETPKKGPKGCPILHTAGVKVVVCAHQNDATAVTHAWPPSTKQQKGLTVLTNLGG